MIAAPKDSNGTQAKVRAKIDSNGNLGRFEVLDGGSLYNDSEGPILVSLLPPKPTSNLVETETGEVVSALKAVQLKKSSYRRVTRLNRVMLW